MSAFRAAMDKVDLCLGQAAMLKSQDKETCTSKYEIIRKAEDMYKKLTPQDMISRRCMKNMTNDFMELLYFIAGKRVSFPVTIIKTFPSMPTDDNISKSALYFPFEYARDTDTSGEENDPDQDEESYSHIRHENEPSLSIESNDMRIDNDADDTSDSDEDGYSSEDECVSTHDVDIYANIMSDIRNFLDIEAQSEVCLESDSVAMVTEHESIVLSVEPPETPADVISHKPQGDTVSLAVTQAPHVGPSDIHANESILNVSRGKESESPTANPHATTVDRQVPLRCIESSTHSHDAPEPTPASALVAPSYLREGITYRDSSASTLDQISTESLNRHSNVSNTRFRTPLLRVANLVDRETYVTERSIDLEMAEGNTGGGWERWTRKRDKPKSDNKCDGCADRLDSLERHRKRAEEAEESSIEVMRNMCIRFDEMSDELRRVKRRVNELSSAMPIVVADDVPTHGGRQPRNPP